MQLQKIRMTLTGGLEGKTIVLHRRQFTDGVFEATIPQNDVGGLKKYYTSCYQVKFENLTSEPKEEVKEVKDNMAIRVDDSAVLTDEQVEDKEDGIETPNDREQAIIAAVNCIDKKDFIEQDTNPHPKVKDVATLMDDPTVTKAEICEVIEKWLS